MDRRDKRGEEEVKITKIGIDIDNYASDPINFERYVDRCKSRARMFGKVYRSRKTKNGYHLFVKLDRSVNFWRSIELRYYCGDDPRRCFYDIMRYRTGGRFIDTLFDRKKRFKRSKDQGSGHGE